MGVYEETPVEHIGMHWQQHERYVGPAYDPSRDLSPNLPVHSCDSSSMGDVEPSLNNSLCSTSGGSSSTCSTPNSNSNASNNNNNNTTTNNNKNNSGRFPGPLRPKLEHGSPSTPPASGDDAVVCAGCGRRITDRYYLLAVDRRWHAACLQCCQCHQALDGEVTCFARDGNIYCKEDYYRLFGMKRCARCQATILSSEMVMRARDLVFHVHCFTCAVCNAALTKGDHFGMRDGAVLCRMHFELASPGPGPANPHYPPQFPSPEFHPHHHHHHHHHHPSPLPLQPPPAPSSCADPDVASKVPFFNGAATGTTRQKGRPRKRKPKDLEAMTASLDLNADYLDAPFVRGGPATPGMPGSNGQQRTKRMRTSFKHHQLRTMKSYFAINHNPDAKDLKQLSQKTGLPKRVLQVWFQNARAKWRRMVLKQEGKAGSGDKCSGSDPGGSSLADLEAYQQHGPGDYHPQALPPHSPPFILGGGSPPLECS
ncbi:LIM/homeobox protein Lhx9 [Anabrus simplex]|uniref:LIM/homeobox protein Lhx9 n=1 Tax=Anabrus simplex TaxID=316456 RepID=UPI0034DD0715